MPKQESIFKLDIKEMMRSRGLKPKPFTLQKVGFTLNRAQYILNRNPRYIHLLELERLCFLMHCTPYELLKIPFENTDKVPEKHPLKDWIAPKNAQGAINYLKILPPEKLAAAEEMMRRLYEE